MTRQLGGGRATRTVVTPDAVALQRHPRNHNDSNPFPHGSTRAVLPWRHDMSLLIEDLARDRMRQIQRDSERARQIRQARQARRAAKANSQR
jgi:hypothetical protein